MPEIDRMKLVRKYLKLKLLCDDVTWRGSAAVKERTAELIKRTVQHGEAHSALIIGPRGCGKTTLISSVLAELEAEMSLEEDAVVVRLNGLLHHEEKLALQAITTQMQLENAVGERVFGTVAENLSFLLSCLRTGEGRRCRSMVFILDEFHAFCHGGLGQTLLYNLFDITHSAQAPLCVLGITSRLDVMELLEKRVKSRFSHNHIFVFPNECDDGANPQNQCEHFQRLFVDLLSLPYEFAPKTDETFNQEKNLHRKRNKSISASASNTPTKSSKKLKNECHVVLDKLDEVANYADTRQFALPQKVLDKCRVNVTQFQKLDKEFVGDWNAHIKALSQDSKVVDAIEKFCYYSVNEQVFRDVLLQLASMWRWDASSVASCVDAAVSPELRSRHLQSLSILELSLLIAMKHGMEVFDGQPMNFEMVLHRYTKFANTNSSAQAVPRPVILKAFEHLQALEFIAAVRGTDGAAGHTGTNRVQKEYQLYTLAVSVQDIHDAAGNFKALPTEIMHWLNNSVV